MAEHSEQLKRKTLEGEQNKERKQHQGDKLLSFIAGNPSKNYKFSLFQILYIAFNVVAKL